MRNLDVVKGAISTKDLVPVLTHFALHDGRLCGFDGRVYIDAPASETKGLALTVPAIPFIAAIEACGEIPPKMSFTDGRCEIKAGTFRASLPTGPLEDFPSTVPDGKKAKCSPKGGFLERLRILRPFVGEDASRPWVSGILLMGAKAIATNNIVIAEVSLPNTLWPAGCILPMFAVDELLRIGHEPIAYARTEQALTFFLPGDIWLRTKLIAGEWPEGALTLIRSLHMKAKWTKVPDGLLAAVERVLPFCADEKAPIVRLEAGKVSTSGEIMSAEVTGFRGLDKCAFRVEPLREVLAHALEIDWSAFPRVPWRGKDIDGAVVGSIL